MCGLPAAHAAFPGFERQAAFLRLGKQTRLHFGSQFQFHDHGRSSCCYCRKVRCRLRTPRSLNSLYPYVADQGLVIIYDYATRDVFADRSNA
jgi:hypothetical protein